METYNYTDQDVQLWMDSAEKIIRQTGELIKTNLGKAANLANKDSFEGHASNVLTETDVAVEKLFRESISALFSDHKFIGEENEGTAGDKIQTYSNNPTWIIDPIDGTMNFVHGNPVVCTSVGLAINRRIVGGIVNCPVINHMYKAIKGQGAYLNDNSQKLQTSGRKHLKDAMVLLEMPTGANPLKKETALHNMSILMDSAHAVRCPGPAATDIAWVGSGSADAFFHMGIHCWDMAAGALIIKEAGGCVLHTDGSEFNLMGRQIVAASSEELAREIISKIRIYQIEAEFDEHCPI